MASDRDRNERGLAYNANVRSQAKSPKIHTALVRKLKSRHVSMIRSISLRACVLPPWLTRAFSIGGVIGTGLFFGTATTLNDAGPLGIFLVYMFIGTICFATMVSLGEMIIFLPLPGGFIKLAERFVDPAFAFATGWNYWYQLAVRLVQRRI